MKRTQIHGAILAILLAVTASSLWLAYQSTQEKEPLRSESVLRFDPAPVSIPPLDQVPKTQARNLVILIGDGMGFSHLQAARSILHGPDGRLTIERFPVTGWSNTHSAKQLYTDSAAGATAFATGQKTSPGALSVDADGVSLPTLFEAARDAGKAVGVITDSAFFDATPAAFLAHRESRRDTFGVIKDMVASGADLIVGEGVGKLEEQEEWPQALADLEEHGLTLARDLDALQSSTGPVLGLMAAGTIASSEQSPSLVELAAWAVERLSKEPGGFVLMVETEETDTASHRNELERMVRGIESLDKAAKMLVDRLGEEAETLVVVTSDHETGGLAVYNGRDGETITHEWATGGHTAEPVPVLAWGPGAPLFSGVHDNTDLASLFAAALGIECCGWTAPMESDSPSEPSAEADP